MAVTLRSTITMRTGTIVIAALIYSLSLVCAFARQEPCTALPTACSRLSLREFRGLDSEEMAALAGEPVIIRSGWFDPEAYARFQQAYGHHDVLARRTRFAYHLDDEAFGTYADRLAAASPPSEQDGAAHVPLSELMRHVDHVILFDGEPGMSGREARLL